MPSSSWKTSKFSGTIKGPVTPGLFFVQIGAKEFLKLIAIIERYITMSKLLKLTGLKSYTAPALGEVVVQKGQIIRVSDKIARLLEKGQKNPKSADDEPIPYFTEPTISEAGKVDIDFTIPKPTEADEPDEDETPPAPTRAPAKKAAVRRGQR